MDRLQNKAALITGAGAGIGAATARLFCAQGARVCLLDANPKALQDTLAQLKSEFPLASVHTAQADIAHEAQAQAAVLGAVEVLGGLDVLVNNAGAIPGGSLHDLDEQRWRQAWELKLFSYINLTRCYLPMMEQRGRGVICNIIGLAGVAPRYDYICGSTANAGLIAFTQGLGGGSVRKGVRVFGINPAPTRSQRMQTMLERQAKNKWGDTSRWMELSTKLPFGRMAEPDEIARMTVFACSPLSGYLSGTVINLDAGQIYADPV